jgi:SOS-response transcriptional repressor LexA
MEMEQAAITLKRLRERAGLSMERMASALGYKKPSGYQYYEAADKFKKYTLPLDMVESLIKVLAGKGEPPVTAEEVFRLSGIGRNRLMELYLLTLKDKEGMGSLASNMVELRTRVPILTALDAGRIMKLESGSPEGEGFITIPGGLIPGGFAIELTDDAMSPLMPLGTVVVTDPRETPTPGKIVLATLPDVEGVVCRTLKISVDQNKKFADLTPMNDAYPSFKGIPLDSEGFKIQKVSLFVRKV